MSATASWLRRYGLEAAWGVFAVVNLGLMFVFPHYPTVPFHIIWISLTLLYGLRTWRDAPMLALLVVVCLATGTMLWHLTSHGFVDWEELLEVPLMAVVFLAMVWHARRRQVALEEAGRLARSERALRERERTFARQASHQLKGPLTVARGHAQLVLQRTTDPEIAEDVSVVIAELDKLSGTARRLLELGAIEQRETLHRTPCDVDELVTTTAARWATTTDRRWEAAGRTGAVLLVDRERVEAALYELIDNAVKHTSAGECIALTADLDGDELVLAVEDDGAGVDAEDLDHLFDQFWRGASRHYQGTGLGLAIVKAVATVHGGLARAEQLPSGGTRVAVTLPAQPSPPRAGRPVEDPVDAVSFGATDRDPVDRMTGT